LLITVLSLAPGLAIMVTCFPFLVTVLSILRQAIGLQQSPPNMLIVSLALFLTYFIMEPVFTSAWENGIQPLTSNLIEPETAFVRTLEPFRVFMAARLDPETFFAMSELRAETINAHHPLKLRLGVFGWAASDDAHRTTTSQNKVQAKLAREVLNTG